MRIIIKKLDGKKEEQSVEKTDTVMKLREQLAESQGIQADQIRLIHKGAPMKDDNTLADCRVQAGETIHLILQMRGGRN